MSSWVEAEKGVRWTRADGAVVRLKRWNCPSIWIAFEPWGEECLGRRRRRGARGSKGGPRRWKTAFAAMAEVDRLFPEPEAKP